MQHDRDWSHYNKQLVNRGKINFWIKSETLEGWKAKKVKKNGRPFIYADAAVLAMLYIRFKFHLSLRELEGFFLSLWGYLKKEDQVPCYTQVCRRMKRMKLPEELVSKKQVTDSVFDPTGLKVYGVGEWRGKKYGGKRGWKKLHLAMDLKSKKLILCEVSDEYTHDATYLEEALKRASRKKGKILFDGAGDTKKCYAISEKYNKQLLTPPKKGAILHKEEGYERRNEALCIIRGLGGDKLARSLWEKLVGYNHRVEIESAIARWKKIYGDHLKSRTEERMHKEVFIKAQMLNEMTRIKGHRETT